MSGLHDTILNVTAFAYIGLLLWLYFKPSAIDEDEADKSQEN